MAVAERAHLKAESTLTYRTTLAIFHFPSIVESPETGVSLNLNYAEVKNGWSLSCSTYREQAEVQVLLSAPVKRN